MNKKFFAFLCCFLFLLTPYMVFAENEILDSSVNVGLDSSENMGDEEINNSIIPYVNENTSYQVIIDDQADLLSEEEKTKLVDDMSPLTEYGNIAFVSISDNPQYSASSFARDYYHSHFSTQSGSLFLIDMATREIYIFSDGDNYLTITSSKAYSITDNTYMFAKDGDYYSCAKKSFQQIYTLLDGGKIAEPMRLASNIVLSLVFAFLINFLFVFFKSKIRKATDHEIIKNCTIDFHLGKVTAEKTGSHSVYSPVESSSGGSSGGGGGGGGSSGGGGGHSF